MPDGARSSFARQDSGLCSDLMNRLSLSDCSRVSTGPEVWKDYYEPDDDGDVQLHLAIASGYLEVVDSLIRMAPSTEFLSIQNNQVTVKKTVSSYFSIIILLEQKNSKKYFI